MKIEYSMPKPKGMTRKGTKPNTAGEKLVTITDGTSVKRVVVSKAREMVGSGWRYCPKSEYKNAQKKGKAQ